MMRLKQSLRNLARRGLNIWVVLLLVLGCSFSTQPTYTRQNIGKSIQGILAKEYKIGVRVKLVGQTLWIYLPFKRIFEKSDKPEKKIEKFRVALNTYNFVTGGLRVTYLIRVVPQIERIQEDRIIKSVFEKINKVGLVMRRAIFSMDKKNKESIKFCCLVIADIKNGFEMRQLFYCQDISKVSYRIISPLEYQHRVSFTSALLPKIINDREGRYIDYKNVSLKDFVAEQIKHRINLKFQESEVDQDADIDKEIEKIVIETINIYGFKGFKEVELNNLFRDEKIALNIEK